MGIAELILGIPAVRRAREDEDYEAWMERPVEHWPTWVYRRWQAERYAEGGY